MYSIEVTSDSINVIKGMALGNTIKVDDSFSVPVPKNMVRNGYIKNIEAVAASLREALLERNIRSGKTIIIINSVAIKTKDIVVPNLPRQRILEIMKKDISEIINEEEHIIDYTVYGKKKDNKRILLYCNMVACPLELIKQYMDLCKAVNLEISKIEVHNSVMYKNFKKVEPQIKKRVDEGKTAVKKKNKKGEQEEINDIAAQEDNTSITKQKLQLWIGLYDEEIKLLTNALDGNFFAKTVMLESKTILYNQEDQENQREEQKQKMIQYINEIKNLVEFQKRTYPQEGIKEILIYGGYSEQMTIRDLINNVLGIPARLIEKPRYVAGISEEDYPRYCCTIGSMLRR
jgi:Tfp pilus assembly PilM family ATPase